MKNDTEQNRVEFAEKDGRKKKYTKPKLTFHGDIRAVTLSPTFGENIESFYDESSWTGGGPG